MKTYKIPHSVCVLQFESVRSAIDSNTPISDSLYTRYSERLGFLYLLDFISEDEYKSLCSRLTTLLEV